MSTLMWYQVNKIHYRPIPIFKFDDNFQPTEKILLTHQQDTTIELTVYGVVHWW